LKEGEAHALLLAVWQKARVQCSEKTLVSTSRIDSGGATVSAAEYARAHLAEKLLERIQEPELRVKVEKLLHAATLAEAKRVAEGIPDSDFGVLQQALRALNIDARVAFNDDVMANASSGLRGRLSAIRPEHTPDEGKWVEALSKNVLRLIGSDISEAAKKEIYDLWLKEEWEALETKIYSAELGRKRRD